MKIILGALCAVALAALLTVLSNNLQLRSIASSLQLGREPIKVGLPMALTIHKDYDCNGTTKTATLTYDPAQTSATEAWKQLDAAVAEAKKHC